MPNDIPLYFFGTCWIVYRKKRFIVLCSRKPNTDLTNRIYMVCVCTMHCVCLGFRLHSASTTQRSRVISWRHPDLSAYSRLAVFQMETSKTGLVFLNATYIKVFFYINSPTLKYSFRCQMGSILFYFLQNMLRSFIFRLGIISIFFTNQQQ